MLTTKSRAQGNSVVVTLPINGKEKPKVDETYLVFYEDDGSIILIPKIEDPFEDDGDANNNELIDVHLWSSNCLSETIPLKSLYFLFI